MSNSNQSRVLPWYVPSREHFKQNVKNLSVCSYNIQMLKNLRQKRVVLELIPFIPFQPEESRRPSDDLRPDEDLVKCDRSRHQSWNIRTQLLKKECAVRCYLLARGNTGSPPIKMLAAPYWVLGTTIGSQWLERVVQTMGFTILAPDDAFRGNFRRA